VEDIPSLIMYFMILSQQFWIQ